MARFRGRSVELGRPGQGSRVARCAARIGTALHSNRPWCSGPAAHPCASFSAARHAFQRMSQALRFTHGRSFGRAADAWGHRLSARPHPSRSISVGNCGGAVWTFTKRRSTIRMPTAVAASASTGWTWRGWRRGGSWCNASGWWWWRAPRAPSRSTRSSRGSIGCCVGRRNEWGRARAVHRWMRCAYPPYEPIGRGVLSAWPWFSCLHAR